MARRSVALLAGNPGSQGATIRRTLTRLGCSVKTVRLLKHDPQVHGAVIAP